MPRVYVRKFDYDEAARLHAEGKTYREIAEMVGVSVARVRQVLIPEEGARAEARSREWGHSGKCIDCGAPVWRFGRPQARCVSCKAKHLATSVREDELRCAICREWKPDRAFPSNRSETRLRRGRHGTCRVCLTAAKRAWRERTKIPCIDCGTPTASKNRSNPHLPIRCHACAVRAASQVQNSQRGSET